MEGLSIGRIRDIEVRLHWSLAVTVLLLAWSLAEVVFPDLEPGYTVAEYWFVALISACVLFAGLLAHELGHSIQAAREGISVRRISLWLFGGLAELEERPDDPEAAFRIAAMGPIVSLALGIVGLTIGTFMTGLAGVAVFWFGVANLVLAVFNLLPAFPLDGGRIYQAWRWRRSGNPERATQQAAALGLAIGALLILIGLVQALAGAPIGGIWLMLIGLFVRDAARHERLRSREHGPLAHLRIEQVMSREPDLVPPDMRLSDFLATVFFGGRHAAYPVGTAPDDVHGLITLNAVRRQVPEHLGRLTVAEVTTPLEHVMTTTPDRSVASMLSLVEHDQGTRALVFDDDRLVGIVSPSDVARVVTVVDIVEPTLDLRAHDDKHPARAR